MSFRNTVAILDSGIKVVDADLYCSGDGAFLIRGRATNHQPAHSSAAKAEQRDATVVRAEGTSLDCHGLLLLSLSLAAVYEAMSQRKSRPLRAPRRANRSAPRRSVRAESIRSERQPSPSRARAPDHRCA